MNRTELSDEQLLKAVESAGVVAIGRRIERLGRGALISNQEALGCVLEEVSRLTDAVKQNDPVDVANSLADISAVCIFAVSSMFVKEQELIAAGEKPVDEPVS
jgi:hypothetical protein